MKPSMLHTTLCLTWAVIGLLTAGCSRDEDYQQDTTGLLPVCFDAIGTRTTGANQSDAGSFAQYGTLHALLSYANKEQQTVLTYSNNAWTTSQTIYWQSGSPQANHTLKLWRGEAGEFSLPSNMGGTTSVATTNTPILNYALHDHLFATYTGPAMKQAWKLNHCMAQICVTLKPAAGSSIHTEETLKQATVSMTLPANGIFDTNTGEVTRKANNTATTEITFYQPDQNQAVFYAVALPGNANTRLINIKTASGKTYRYTAAEDITLAAGSCHHFNLALSTSVKPLGITTTGWSSTTESIEVSDKTLTFNNLTPGSLKSLLPLRYAAYFNGIKLNGELNQEDYAALGSFLGSGGQSVSLDLTVSGSYTEIPGFTLSYSSVSSITLAGITKIGNNAFSTTEISSIDIPASVTSLGDYAFASCKNLQTVTLPTSGSITIGQYAFSYCKNLQTVTLPTSGSITIGESAFLQSGLTSIDIPASVTSLGDFAFQECYSLTKVAIYAMINTGILLFIDIPSNAELFLYNNSITTENDIKDWKTWGDKTWQKIHYNYKGSGDKLDAGSYNSIYSPTP